MTNTEAFLTRPPGKTNSSSNIYSLIGDGVTTDFILPSSVKDDRSIEVRLNGSYLYSGLSYTVEDSLLHFLTPPSGNIEIKMIDYFIDQRNYNLSEIRIVPNPYNISNRSTQFGQDAPDRLAFYNLPPLCIIKIYTENGDLIETLDHSNGSGDELWHSLTSSRQLVVSGLYIAYFEVTEDYHDPVSGQLVYKKGDNTVKKFIVIR